MATGEGEDSIELKGSCREAEAWHKDERPGEVTGKSAV